MGTSGPRVIGLTGAISSGKSTALAAFRELGAATLSTDELAHELLTSPEMATQLTDRWGAGIAPGGQVDRAKVGQIVFADPGELRWLESVLHPKVGEEVVRWRSDLPSDARLGVVEVPLLFEAGMEAFFDGTLVVTAGERREGWLRDRGDGGAEGRASRQLTEAEKADRATWVVANDGTPADLQAKLHDLWPELVDDRAGQAKRR